MHLSHHSTRPSTCLWSVSNRSCTDGNVFTWEAKATMGMKNGPGNTQLNQYTDNSCCLLIWKKDCRVWTLSRPGGTGKHVLRDTDLDTNWSSFHWMNPCPFTVLILPSITLFPSPPAGFFLFLLARVSTLTPFLLPDDGGRGEQHL